MECHVDVIFYDDIVAVLELQAPAIRPGGSRKPQNRPYQNNPHNKRNRNNKRKQSPYSKNTDKFSRQKKDRATIEEQIRLMVKM